MAIDTTERLETVSKTSTQRAHSKDPVVYELERKKIVLDEKKHSADDTGGGKQAGASVKEGPEVDDGLPIDRGWAWVVLAGTVFYLFLFGGKRKNYGIFFVAYQNRFHSSASTTSLLTTTQSIVISVTSLFVMTIGMHHMSHRTSVMIGGILMTLVDVTNAFATDIRVLFGTFLVEGIAISFTHPPITANLSEYFNKKRGFANGVAFSGASLGGLVFAPTMTWLFESYGYTGTYLIIAGMMCNVLVTAALLRPMNSFRKAPAAHMEDRSKSDQLINGKWNTEGRFESDKLMNGVLSNEEKSKSEWLMNTKLNAEERWKSEKLMNGKLDITEALLKEREVDLDGIRKTDDRSEFHIDGIKCKTQNSSSSDIDKRGHYMDNLRDISNGTVLAYSHGYLNVGHRSGIESPLIQRTRAFSVGNRRPQKFLDTSQLSLVSVRNIVSAVSRSKATQYATSMDEFCGSALNIQDIHSSAPEKVSTSRTCFSKFKSSLLVTFKLIFDISLFRSGVFPVFLVMAFMFAPSLGLMTICLPPHAKDVGMTSEQTGVLMAVLSALGMVSRIAVAVLHDKRIIPINTILAIIATIAGISAHCLRFFNSFSSLVVFAVIMGLCCEIYQAMYAVVIVEHLTLAKLKSCIGFTVLCHGISMGISFPVVGALKDSTGDYHASYHLLGTMATVGACVAVLLSHVHQRVEKNKVEKTPC